MAYLSDVYLRAGRLDDAPTMAERLLALGRERRERSTEARGWHLFGEIAMQCESPHAEEAEAPYRQALALAEERGLHRSRRIATLALAPDWPAAAGACRTVRRYRPLPGHGRPSGCPRRRRRWRK